jgi:hypothetical protein
METLLLIVLLVHVIALLGVLGSAHHSVAAVDEHEEFLPDWQFAVVPRQAAEPVGSRR